MLGLAAPTPYDLRLSSARHTRPRSPLFWLIMAILSGGENHLPEVLIFIGCAFVSILVHEYGHGLVSRYCGYPPTEIVLFWMGATAPATSRGNAPGNGWPFWRRGRALASSCWGLSSCWANFCSESASPMTWS